MIHLLSRGNSLTRLLAYSMELATCRKILTRLLLRLPEVVGRVGFGKSTIYALIKRGQFPSPIALGARARAWISTEVDAWIAQRILETRWRLIRDWTIRALIERPA